MSMSSWVQWPALTGGAKCGIKFEMQMSNVNCSMNPIQSCHSVATSYAEVASSLQHHRDKSVSERSHLCSSAFQAAVQAFPKADGQAECKSGGSLAMAHPASTE
jgi:hypothetical protein